MRIVVTSGRVERDADNRPTRMLGILADITDKTWIERRARSVADRLRSVSRRLVEVQEAERRLLARELHDRVGQSLTALGLNLRIIASELSPESGQTVSARMEECMRMVEDTVGAPEARGTSVDGIRVHSVRLPSFTVSTEVVFAMPGERLVIRHDAGESAEPYVAGTLAAIRALPGRVGLTRGLDTILLDGPR